MMHWYGTGWSWWAATLMWVGMIAFWALIIGLVFALATGGSRGREGEPTDRARRILDERLARGAIDSEEYRRLRDVMTTTGDRTS